MIVPIPMFHVKININVDLDVNKLIDQLKSKRLPPEAFEIKVSDEILVSDEVSVTVSNLELKGSLSMIKTTNAPTPEELQIIQAARDNRPYNSLSDVKIRYTEKGNISSIEWTES